MLYSMATSTADEAPRGMEFLYNLHRLNVATAGSPHPEIAEPRSRCRFLELAAPADLPKPSRWRRASVATLLGPPTGTTP